MTAENLLAELSVDSRARLSIYADLLLKWQNSINLIGPSTLPSIWSRHFADSLQLHSFASSWEQWVDLGTGAGFPGMVIALTSDDRFQRVHLVESDKRKAAFLREVSRETNVNVEIHAGRIERIMPEIVSSTEIDIVSARALAPLDKLIEYAGPALEQGATCLFLKGKDAPLELTKDVEASSLDITFAESQTDSAAQIVLVRKLASSTNFASRS